jgi:hypothetical protein
MRWHLPLAVHSAQESSVTTRTMYIIIIIIIEVVAFITTTSKVKGKAIPVTGRGGPYGCETSRLPLLFFSRRSAH